MNAKHSPSSAALKLALVAILATLAFGAACTKARTDAAVAQDVQQKILLDQAVSTKQIQVAADHGAVTLAGTVPTEAEREAAATDAGKVEGVRTVLNNLQVAPQVAQAQPADTPPAPAPIPEAVPEKTPVRSSRRPSAYHSHEPYRGSGGMPSAGYGDRDATPAPSQAQSAPAIAPAPVAPPPPPQPVSVSVPEGTDLQVRLTDAISANKNHAGDVLHATLDQPVVVGEQTVIPANADLVGKVVEATAANRISGQPSLSVELTRLSYNGHSYAISTEPYRQTGTARGKRNVKTGAGGAALGAIIGAVAGGGKGAAIGAATGAGAGTAAGAATGNDDVRLESESVMSFKLQSAVTVMPANRASRYRADRDKDQNPPDNPPQDPTAPPPSDNQ